MTKSEYKKYLGSKHWQQRRKRFLEGVMNCNRCDIPRWLAGLLYDQDLHVHHLAYTNLGNEADDELEAICRRCHEIESNGRSEFPDIPRRYCPECPQGNRIFDKTADKCDFCQGFDEGFDVAKYMADHR